MAFKGFGNYIQDGFIRTLDDLRGWSSVNQLGSKVYPQPDVHKSKCPGFEVFGIYGTVRMIAVVKGKYTMPKMKNYQTLPI